MSASFVVFIVVAFLYVMPWARTVDTREAMAAFLGVHIFRHVALQLVSAQHFGFAISDAGRDEIVYGDLIGTVLALTALVAVNRQWKMWRPLTWLFVVATMVDLANALVVGLHEELFAQAQNVSWLILTFYVPLLWVTLGLVVWVLVASRGRAH